MQPLPFFIFIQQTSLRIDGPRQHTSASALPTTFTNQTFASPNFAKQGNQESRYELTARRSLHAGIVANRVPNEVRWKNLLRHLVAETKPSAACRKPLNSLPAFHMLELAKGFEPPTP